MRSLCVAFACLWALSLNLSVSAESSHRLARPSDRLSGRAQTNLYPRADRPAGLAQPPRGNAQAPSLDMTAGDFSGSLKGAAEQNHAGAAIIEESQSQSLVAQQAQEAAKEEKLEGKAQENEAQTPVKVEPPPQPAAAAAAPIAPKQAEAVDYAEIEKAYGEINAVARPQSASTAATPTPQEAAAANAAANAYYQQQQLLGQPGNAPAPGCPMPGPLMPGPQYPGPVRPAIHVDHCACNTAIPSEHCMRSRRALLNRATISQLPPRRHSHCCPNDRI